MKKVVIDYLFNRGGKKMRLKKRMEFPNAWMYPSLAFEITNSNKEDVWIDEETFPDPSFREYIKTLPRRHANRFTQDEIKKIKVIACDGYYLEDHQKIKTIKGIEHFHAVETITISYHHLTSLVLQQPFLKVLNCSHNELRQIKVQSKMLSYLNCDDNKLSYLHIESPNVEVLSYEGNVLPFAHYIVGTNKQEKTPYFFGREECLFL